MPVPVERQQDEREDASNCRAVAAGIGKSYPVAVAAVVAKAAVASPLLLPKCRGSS
jgi:hypothetical protein